MSGRPGGGPALITARRIDLFSAPQLTDAGSLEADHNGGYLRAGADQRLLRTVTRFQARHRADRRIGMRSVTCSCMVVRAHIAQLWIRFLRRFVLSHRLAPATSPTS